MSVWAALVPFAKARMDLGPAELGLLLLCLGVGSLVAMPLTGMMASRFGCGPVILTSGAIACLVLPVLSIPPRPALQAVTLALFGAAIGTLDVAMNIQAVRMAQYWSLKTRAESSVRRRSEVANLAWWPLWGPCSFWR
jgi:predicted MFS family arabinose efflux permease